MYKDPTPTIFIAVRFIELCFLLKPSKRSDIESQVPKLSRMESLKTLSEARTVETLTSGLVVDTNTFD